VINNTLSDIILRRRSIREFTAEEIDIDTVTSIIDIASHAPSNNNRQGWKFFVITDKSIIDKMSRMVEIKLKESKSGSESLNEFMEEYRGNFTVFKNAPVVVICCFMKPAKFNFKIFSIDDENRHFTGELISVSLAMQNIMLLSESVDIGTLVMTAPLVAAHEIKEAVNIPARYSIAAFICMGKYGSRPECPSHKKPEEIIIINSINNKEENQFDRADG